MFCILFEDPGFYPTFTFKAQRTVAPFSSGLLFMTRYCTIVFQPPSFLLKVSCHSNYCFPNNVLFFSVAAKIFYLFCFQQSDYNVPKCLSLYYLASGLLNFWFCKFVFDQVGEIFHIISSDIFPALFSFSFLLGFQMLNSFLLSHMSETLFIYL